MSGEIHRFPALVSEASPKHNAKWGMPLQCLLLSLGVHAVALLLLYQFQPSFLVKQSAFNVEKLPLQPDQELAIAKTRNLDEIFNQILFVSPHLQTPYDQSPLAYEGLNLPTAEEGAAFTLPVSASFPNQLEKEEKNTLRSSPILTLESMEIDAHLIAPEETPLQTIPWIEQEKTLSAELVQGWNFPVETPAEDPAVPSAIAGTPARASVPAGAKAYTEIPAAATPSALTSATPQLASLTSSVNTPLITPQPMDLLPAAWRASLPALQEYALPEEATRQELSAGIDLAVLTAPHPDGKGYLFSLTLLPHFDMQKEKVKQNFYFFIDRSNSIEKHRFTVFKKAALRAISTLQEGDTFNIYLFDNKVTRLSEKNLPFSRKNVRIADAFLDKQESGGLFAAADVYQELSNLLPNQLAEDELHNAFLISDGNTLLTPNKQQMALKNLIQKNGGKISLYTATAGQDNNLALLDLVSAFNGGKMIYSETHTAFPRKLANQVYHMRQPIASHLRFGALSADSDAKIAFYTPSSHLPPLYSNEPYTILGRIENLQDFTLYIQAKHKNQRITLRKEVSFAHAKPSPSALENKWTCQEAREHYDRFLKSGKISELKQAKKILAQGAIEAP